MLVTAMADDARKDEIRRRLILAKYPRRSRATFSDENDHNPRVLRDCPTCHGSGAVSEYWSEEGADVHARVVCTACGGSGVIPEAEPYFPADGPEDVARADAQGWVTCPRCGWRFTTRDRNAWTGRRHLRCGQKIKVIDGGS